MPRWLGLILLWLASFVQAQSGLPRWDALPAVDVQHLQGAYAGRTLCPMCEHGYDAGLLVFLPSRTAPDDAARIARALRTAVADIGSERFRGFLILTGEPPSPALLGAVAAADANWYVAHLAPAGLDAASREFALPLGTLAQGHVFAQRRLLWRFDPLAGDWQAPLDAQARYAMSFLQANYAQASADDDPETPKGRLWLAPNRLSSSATLAASPQTTAPRVCFADATSTPRADSLLALRAPDSTSPQRIAWARSDDSGCMSIEGARNVSRLHVEVFTSLREPASAEIDARSLHADRPRTVRLDTAVDTGVTGREIVVGAPCEGCEAVFDGLPARLDSRGHIAPSAEPGEPLELAGIVRDANGRPRPGIVVYAYHTDRGGLYPRDPRLSGETARHGRLRGWARTDAEGRYAFLTIRPGGYPGEAVPQHVHLHVIEPGRCTYYLGDVLFTDDPRLTPALRARERDAHGGSGIVEPRRDRQGRWSVQRDVVLGLGVPGYERCASR
ncbi:hypothetical protein [Dokdonella sp.]|uniref:dioxygenase family protein n=1 Tax=Dokdonella sp. TaxID=2291710 RepID=UPI001B209058|nr:hypothetical protein [Dokdonella sp.]MBO9663872.1 hypothetical protein [Dokdonella sp.]